MAKKKVSIRQLERCPTYLRFLVSLRNSGVYTVSSKQIAQMMDCSEEQVRKDLQLVSPTKARPGRQRNVIELIDYLKVFLGYNNINEAVVIGVGHLGGALMSFKGFRDFGLEIVAGFDIDPTLIGSKVGDKPIYSMSNLDEIVGELNIKTAILTTPREVSQEVVNKLVNSGVKAIWNFVPVHVDVPDDIVVENIDFAASYAIFSHRINKKRNK